MEIPFVVVALLADSFDHGKSLKCRIQSSIVFFHLRVNSGKLQIVHNNANLFIDKRTEIGICGGEGVQIIGSNDSFWSVFKEGV